MKNKKLMSTFIGYIAAALIFVGMPMVPAQASMIGTAQQLQHSERAEHISKVQQFMARDDVRSQMVALGVSPDAAALRVDGMTDSELQQLSQRIDHAPAGGDGVLVILGVVFLVLIILELVGVTNIFNSR
jgi:hypothetical protein